MAAEAVQCSSARSLLFALSLTELKQKYQVWRKTTHAFHRRFPTRTPCCPPEKNLVYCLRGSFFGIREKSAVTNSPKLKIVRRKAGVHRYSHRLVELSEYLSVPLNRLSHAIDQRRIEVRRKGGGGAHLLAPAFCAGFL